MFVKICGLRTEADVACAVEAGADAVGFVLCESPRQVSPEQAERLAALAPPSVLSVGVFQGVPVEEIRRLVTGSALGAVQLHGDYRAADFAALRDLPVRLVRATSLAAGAPPRVGEYGEELLLLDSPRAGSGHSWDWSALAGSAPAGRWVLAGGLDPENVAAAIAAAAPWGVDVSSGVEASRGVKDPARIRAFVAAARGTFPA